MRFLILLSAFVVILMTAMLGSSQSADKPTIIGISINADMPLSPTQDQVYASDSNLSKMYELLTKAGLAATVFSPTDTVNSYAKLQFTRIGLDPKFELGISGNHSNEKLSAAPFATQKGILETSQRYVGHCNVCGTNEVVLHGFMPQSFDQNQDTYKALDDLGIQYDVGFQAGLLYAPGHENNVWPYLVEGHKFYAVPVSTYTISGKNVVLQDAYFKNNDMTVTQWYDALVGKFDEIQGKDEPLVVSLTTSVSGSGDYLDALRRFMDYTASKKASFVTIAQLVAMAKTGVRDVSALPVSNTSAECTTCGKNTGAIIAISTNNTTQAAKA